MQGRGRAHRLARVQAAGVTAGQGHLPHVAGRATTTTRSMEPKLLLSPLVCGGLEADSPGTVCPGHGLGAWWERCGFPVSARSWAESNMASTHPLSPSMFCSTSHPRPAGTHPRWDGAACHTCCLAVLHQFPLPGYTLEEGQNAWERPAAGGSLLGPERAGKGRPGSQATPAPHSASIIT